MMVCMQSSSVRLVLGDVGLRSCVLMSSSLALLGAQIEDLLEDLKFEG